MIAHVSMLLCREQCFQFELILFLSVDLPSHAARSAQEHQVGEEIHEAREMSDFFNENPYCIADTCKNLDTIIEPDDLVVHWVNPKFEFVHEMNPRRGQRQPRTTATLDTHANSTTVALATDHGVETASTTRKEALTTVVLAPILFQDLSS